MPDPTTEGLIKLIHPDFPTPIVGLNEAYEKHAEKVIQYVKDHYSASAG